MMKNVYTILFGIFLFLMPLIASASVNVSQWNDKSGNGETLYQATSGDRPLYGSTTQNGLNVIVFNGSSDYLWTSSDSNYTRLLYLNSGVSVFIVQSSPSNSQNGYIFSATGGPSNAFDLTLPAGGTYYFDAGNFSSDRITASTSSYTSLGYHIFEGISNHTAGSQFLNYDGTTIATGTNATALSNPSCPLYIGLIAQTCTSNLAGQASTTLGEVIVFEAALTQTQYQNVEGYLACKWGLQGNLPGGHPYKSSCPSYSSALTYLQTQGTLGSWYDASDYTTVTPSIIVTTSNNPFPGSW